MIVYNITISVDSKKEGEFIQWMKETYIPMVLNTGCFYEHRFMRLLHQGEEGEGTNFATQFFAENMKNMIAFEQGHSQKIHEELDGRFSGDFVFFRSLLESVD
ncbi:MAG: DUF4286 family protein [Lunatimonas sp.]|uniref:DUF4286 family protein n=1 Tax=Lunatimonas sp. TaxID=2060141 RepID=UPI00263A4FF1|nr:DUF4286 family protein [Lunatimonas sp.]MCC5937584.1 DUF4286 family protein [Lunatimonas sp.]